MIIKVYLLIYMVLLFAINIQRLVFVFFFSSLVICFCLIVVVVVVSQQNKYQQCKFEIKWLLFMLYLLKKKFIFFSHINGDINEIERARELIRAQVRKCNSKRIEFQCV